MNQGTIIMTSEEKEIPIFPITGWNIGTVPAMDAVFIQLEFLSSPMQSIEQADPGRRYVFQHSQLRELRDALTRALAHLESAGFQPPPGTLQ
jgi:biofilm regulator BssS